MILLTIIVSAVLTLVVFGIGYVAGSCSEPSVAPSVPEWDRRNFRDLMPAPEFPRNVAEARIASVEGSLSSVARRLDGIDNEQKAHDDYITQLQMFVDTLGYEWVDETRREFGWKKKEKKANK